MLIFTVQHLLQEICQYFTALQNELNQELNIERSVLSVVLSPKQNNTCSLLIK